MARYDDINPMDIDPETNRPYANYSSPSLDTSFHDGEMDVDDDDDVCGNCGADLDDGEGYNGLCGDCADREEV